MQGEAIDPEDAAEEYYVVPEEALQFLPEELRTHYQAMADNGRAILKSVDNELAQLSRISASSEAMVVLKHIQKRLAAYEFAADMDAFLELDMLTTAFVVTYVRLHQGGSGSGFSRDALPPHLRESHDQIIELRNKRFAHSAGHHSASDALEIGFGDNRFHIKLGFSLGYYIGGANEWHELVKVLDALIADRLDKVVERLREKTGYEWVLPKCSALE